MVCARLKKFLDESGVEYTVIKHTEAFTAQEMAAAMHYKGRALVKVVMLDGDLGSIMVALPADRRVDVASLREGLGLKMAALATEEEFRHQFPDCEVGAMPPFGNLYGVPVYVDSALAGDEEIVFQAGTHYEAVKMKYADYERLVGPKVMGLSRKAA